jgi:hypothetical protein
LRSNPPDWSIHIEQALAPLDHIARLANGSFARFVLAICPAPWQASPAATPGGGVRAKFGIPDKMLFDSRQPFDRVVRYSQQHGITVCNTFDPILQAKAPEELFLRNSPEFSAAGHEFFARRLAQCIIATVPGVWTESSDTPQLQPVSGIQPGSRRQANSGNFRRAN